METITDCSSPKHPFWLPTQHAPRASYHLSTPSQGFLGIFQGSLLVHSLITLQTMSEAISSTVKVSKASQSVSSEETSPIWYHPHPGHQTLNIQSFLMNALSFPSMLNHHSQFSSVAQSCLTLYDPMDCSTPDCPVSHQLPEFAQTHVYRVGDAIQPSHPLSSPSSPTFNLSRHQGLFK